MKQPNKIKLNQKGFSHVEAVIAILVVVGIAAAGTKVMFGSHAATPTGTVTTNTAYKYKTIGSSTDSNGITYTVAACKKATGNNYVVNALNSISPANTNNIAHSSIVEAYSKTNSSSYLDYGNINATEFQYNGSNGSATSAYTVPKTQSGYMYWEGDYFANGTGVSNFGSGVHIPSPFKSFAVKKLINC
jgi:hypothetical protein